MLEEKESQNLGEGRLVQKQGEKALLVGTYVSGYKKEKCLEHLEELASLCDTYGIIPFEKLPCPLRKIESSTFLGKGKIEEILQKCEEQEIGIVLFDDEIAPQQQRNLEKILKRTVIDRTELILGVFAQRAQTKEAVIQINLALFKYQLPRLKKLWTHLGRQKVGGGGKGGHLKGEGESQLEIDKRLLRKKIEQLQKKLLEVQKHREVQRKARQKTNIPTFAIVGYTNTGKSTLFKTLTSAEVFIEDKLFATLDTTTRKFFLPNHQKILLIDTVGFIQKIPHTLVAAFKSTLEEAVQTDILMHVIDVSSPYCFDQAEATLQVLTELKASNRPIITVLNKIDACKDMSLVKKFRIKYPKTVAISAKEKENISELLEKMEEEIVLLRKTVHLKIPQSHYKMVSSMMKEGRVISLEYVDNDIFLEMEIPAELEHKIEQFIIIK